MRRVRGNQFYLALQFLRLRMGWRDGIRSQVERLATDLLFQGLTPSLAWGALWLWFLL